MNSQVKGEKRRMRLEALARRDALPATARIEASLLAAENARRALSMEPGEIVAGFLPIRSEIDPRPLMTMLADRGVRLAAPAIVGDDIEFRELVREAELVAGDFGILAPGLDAAVVQPTVVLVPLAAFDRRGHRIGYGRGFYDRAIAALRNKGGDPLLCGLAFRVQEVESVPSEAHDEPLHLVVTEREIIRIAPRAGA